MNLCFYLLEMIKEGGHWLLRIFQDLCVVTYGEFLQSWICSREKKENALHHCFFLLCLLCLWSKDLLLSLLKVEAPFYSFSVDPVPRMGMRYPSGNCVPNIHILNCGTVLHPMCAERLVPWLLKPKSRSICTQLYAHWSVVPNEPISGKRWHNVCLTWKST